MTSPETAHKSSPSSQIVCDPGSDVTATDLERETDNSPAPDGRSPSQPSSTETAAEATTSKKAQVVSEQGSTSVSSSTLSSELGNRPWRDRSVSKSSIDNSHAEDDPSSLPALRLHAAGRHEVNAQDTSSQSPKMRRRVEASSMAAGTVDEQQPEPKRLKIAGEYLRESQRQLSSTAGGSSTPTSVPTVLPTASAEPVGIPSAAATGAVAAQPTGPMHNPTVNDVAQLNVRDRDTLPQNIPRIRQGQYQPHPYDQGGTMPSRGGSDLLTAFHHPYVNPGLMQEGQYPLVANVTNDVHPSASYMNLMVQQELQQEQEQRQQYQGVHQELQQSRAALYSGLDSQGFPYVPHSVEYYRQALDELVAERARIQQLIVQSQQQEQRLEMALLPPVVPGQSSTILASGVGGQPAIGYASNTAAAADIERRREELMVLAQQQRLQQYPYHVYQPPLPQQQEQQLTTAENLRAHNQLLSSMSSMQGEPNLDSLRVPVPAQPQPSVPAPLPLACALSPSVEYTRADGLNSIPSGVPIYTSRKVLSLADADDSSRLSEYLCFVREHCIEVFRATLQDVQTRNVSRSVVVGQCGLRCKFCAHLHRRDRTSRSSSFPSSLSRIYQSITMMLRDHFSNCDEMPEDVRRKFFALKSMTASGSSNSKQHWVDSARRIGMYDAVGRILLRGHM